MRSPSSSTYSHSLSASMGASYIHGQKGILKMPAIMLTWTTPQAQTIHRRSSHPPSRIVSPQTSLRDGRQTPSVGLNGQVRPRDIHWSGWISSPTSEIHLAHPRAQSKRCYLPTFEEQHKEQVHVFFRHQRHEVTVYGPPTGSGIWPLCAVLVNALTPVPAPFPPWNPRVRPPPLSPVFSQT
jgi:hypothetical protein